MDNLSGKNGSHKWTLGKLIRFLAILGVLYSEALISDYLLAPLPPMSCCRCNRSGKCRSCVWVKSGKRCTTCLPARRGNCQNHMVGDAALSTEANDQENEPRTNEITTPGNLTSCPREEEVPLSEASENCESDEFLPDTQGIGRSGSLVEELVQNSIWWAREGICTRNGQPIPVLCECFCKVESSSEGCNGTTGSHTSEALQNLQIKELHQVYREETVCGNKVTSKLCLKRGGQFKEGFNPTEEQRASRYQEDSQR